MDSALQCSACPRGVLPPATPPKAGGRTTAGLKGRGCLRVLSACPISPPSRPPQGQLLAQPRHWDTEAGTGTRTIRILAPRGSRGRRGAARPWHSNSRETALAGAEEGARPPSRRRPQRDRARRGARGWRALSRPPPHFRPGAGRLRGPRRVPGSAGGGAQSLRGPRGRLRPAARGRPRSLRRFPPPLLPQPSRPLCPPLSPPGVNSAWRGADH